MAILAGVILGWACVGYPLFRGLMGTLGPVTPPPDAGYLSCHQGVRKNVDEEVYQPFYRTEATEACVSMPDWAGRLRELQTAYDGCPDPVDPQLIQGRAYVAEWFDEFLLVMEMATNCCDGNADCDPDGVEAHWERVKELDKLMSALVLPEAQPDK